MIECPSDEIVARFALKDLPAEERAALVIHFAGCDECRAVLAAAASSTAGGAHAPLRSGAPALEHVAPERYVIERERARGGMGCIFEARDVRHGRRVALKVLLRAEPEAAARFLREMRITARLQHP